MKLTHILLFLLGLSVILFLAFRQYQDVEIPIIHTVTFGMNVQNSRHSISNLKIKQEKSSLKVLEKEFDIDVSFDLFLDSSRPGHKSTVSALHLSDRLISDEDLPYDRIIELTPIVDTEILDNKVLENQKRSISKTLAINALCWGENKILIKCGSEEKIIQFRKTK